MRNLQKIGLSLLCGIASVCFAEKPINIIEDAYIYAYPLVLSNVTKNVMTNIAQPNALGHAPVNQFSQVKNFPTDSAKDVIRPNVDTLYSTAWVNTAKEPVVMIVPNSNGRYYVLEMMDAWTDVFAAPGSRTTGDKAQKMAIVGPHWKGKLPADVKKLVAPTEDVWIIGRTQANGVKDLPAVNAFQDGMKLIPLSQLNNPNYQPSDGVVDSSIDGATPPPKQVAAMDAPTFFTHFANVVKTNPAHKTDALMLARLKKIGIVPGKAFTATDLSAEQVEMFNQAAKSAQEKIVATIKQSGTVENGWLVHRKQIGTYGNDYLARAAVAFYGLGANLPEDAIYPALLVDKENQPLNGKNKYVLHFAKNALPPVHAFWSLTLYNDEGYFYSNAINRYAISGHDNNLKLNADGSLDLYIQHESPGADKESNWLPTPSDNFNLLMRLYWPKPAALSGKWMPPQIIKLS